MIAIDGIVGARPNLMKMAPLARALAADGVFQLRLIHTGQHYDRAMSEVFFEELGLSQPAFNLEVGGGTAGEQTARILERYEGILLDGPRPRGVVVVGDVTSTMACTLAAVKLGVSVAHVEAGLRSGDRSMPEEINRIVTDSVADLLLVSDASGLSNLAREGHPNSKVSFVGNLMIDTLFRELPRAEQSPVLKELGLEGLPYAYLTLHRPANVDDPTVLQSLMDTVTSLSEDLPIVFAVHPRTRARLANLKPPFTPSERLRIIEPLGYRDNLQMIRSAAVVLTDSGGIQEESSVLNVPCLTLRDSTERPVTVELGSSELVGANSERIREAWSRVRSGRWKKCAGIPLWDGQTAGRIVAVLRKAWGQDRPSGSMGGPHAGVSA